METTLEQDLTRIKRMKSSYKMTKCLVNNQGNVYYREYEVSRK